MRSLARKLSASKSGRVGSGDGSISAAVVVDALEWIALPALDSRVVDPSSMVSSSRFFKRCLAMGCSLDGRPGGAATDFTKVHLAVTRFSRPFRQAYGFVRLGGVWAASAAVWSDSAHAEPFDQAGRPPALVMR